MRQVARFALLALTCLALSGCAFDVVRVQHVPAKLRTDTAGAPVLRLADTVEVDLGTGYSRTLRAGTHWTHVGTLPQGEVYKTDDQVLTVEASNIYEAYIVVRDRALVGFYLPVERAFSPLRTAVDLPLAAARADATEETT